MANAAIRGKFESILGSKNLDEDSESINAPQHKSEEELEEEEELDAQFKEAIEKFGSELVNGTDDDDREIDSLIMQNFLRP